MRDDTLVAAVLVVPAWVLYCLVTAAVTNTPTITHHPVIHRTQVLKNISHNVTNRGVLRLTEEYLTYTATEEIQHYVSGM